MKIKHSILLIATGYCFDFAGAMMKIMHKPYAHNILIIGTIVKIVGVLVLVYKLTTHPKMKDFMNW